MEGSELAALEINQSRSQRSLSNVRSEPRMAALKDSCQPKSTTTRQHVQSRCPVLDLEMTYLDETRQDLDDELKVLRDVRDRALLLMRSAAQAARSPSPVRQVCYISHGATADPSSNSRLQATACPPNTEWSMHAGNKTPLLQSQSSTITCSTGCTEGEPGVPAGSFLATASTPPRPLGLRAWAPSPPPSVTFGHAQQACLAIGDQADRACAPAMSSTAQPVTPTRVARSSPMFSADAWSSARAPQLDSSATKASLLVGERRGYWRQYTDQEGVDRASSDALPLALPSNALDTTNGDDEDVSEICVGDEVVDRFTSRRSTVMSRRKTEVLLKMDDGSEIWRPAKGLEKVPKLNLVPALRLMQDQLAAQDGAPPIHKRGDEARCEYAPLSSRGRHAKVVSRQQTECDEDDADDSYEGSEICVGDEVIERLTSRRSTVLSRKRSTVLLRMDDGSEKWRSTKGLAKVPKLNLSPAVRLMQDRIANQDVFPPLHKRGDEGESDDDEDDRSEICVGDEVIDRLTARRSTVLTRRKTEALLEMDDGSKIWRPTNALEKVPKLNLAPAVQLSQDLLARQDECPPPLRRRSDEATVGECSGKKDVHSMPRGSSRSIIPIVDDFRAHREQLELRQVLWAEESQIARERKELREREAFWHDELVLARHRECEAVQAIAESAELRRNEESVDAKAQYDALVLSRSLEQKVSQKAERLEKWQVENNVAMDKMEAAWRDEVSMMRAAEKSAHQQLSCVGEWLEQHMAHVQSEEDQWQDEVRAARNAEHAACKRMALEEEVCMQQIDRLTESLKAKQIELQEIHESDVRHRVAHVAHGSMRHEDSVANRRADVAARRESDVFDTLGRVEQMRRELDESIDTLGELYADRTQLAHVNMQLERIRAPSMSRLSKVPPFSQLPAFMQQVALSVSCALAYQRNERTSTHKIRMLWEESLERERGYWEGKGQSDFPNAKLDSLSLETAAHEANDSFMKAMSDAGAEQIGRKLGIGLARAVHRFNLIPGIWDVGLRWAGSVLPEAGSLLALPEASLGNGGLGVSAEQDEFVKTLARMENALAVQPDEFLRMMAKPNSKSRPQLQMQHPNLDRFGPDSPTRRSSWHAGGHIDVDRAMTVVAGAKEVSLGFTARWPPGEVKITSVASPSWAKDVGLTIGCKIMSINGTPTHTLTAMLCQQKLLERPLVLFVQTTPTTPDWPSRRFSSGPHDVRYSFGAPDVGLLSPLEQRQLPYRSAGEEVDQRSFVPDELYNGCALSE